MAKMRKIQAGLAILLMFMTYGLPSGLHLNLCVGEDGHWDISVIVCESNQDPVAKPPKADPIAHLKDCADFTTACDGKKMCIPDGVPFIQKASAKTFQLTSLTEAPAIVTLPVDKPSAFSSPPEETSFNRLPYLRTVVLLI